MNFCRQWGHVIQTARCRQRGVSNQIQAIFIKGSGDITPLQDHTPSLACEIVMEGVGGLAEFPIRRQQPPESGSHGVTETLLAAVDDMSAEREAGCWVFRFGEGIYQLFHRREIFLVAIAKVLKTHTIKR